jgi:phage protein D
VTKVLDVPDFKVEVDGTELVPEVARHVAEVEVISTPSLIDHVSITLANPFPELRWTHSDDATLFAEGASVVVKMGYVDKTKTVFDGEVTALTPSFRADGPSTVRVDGMSRLHWLDRGSKVRTFQDATDSEIVEQVANEAQLTPDVESTDTKHAYVVQRNQTDLAFVLERARSVRYEVATEGKKLVFRKAKEGAAKSYTLVWGNPQEAIASDDALPLRSFAPRLDGRRARSAVIVRGQDPATGEPIEERAASGDEDATMDGADSAADLSASRFGAPELVIADRPVASADEARAVARAEFNRLARRLVTGHGVSIGVADLRSGSVVDLRGIGRYSGPYYVTTATHRISTRGYETTFEVERGSIG